jgi:hypothetical protein
MSPRAHLVSLERRVVYAYASIIVPMTFGLLTVPAKETVSPPIT